jgi:hypothetical protein
VVNRRARARGIVASLVLLLLSNAAALVWLALPWIALVVGLMVLVVLYDAKKSLPELEGEQLVPESSSRFRHVIEYGVVALGGGLAFAGDAAVRRFGLDPPWRFGWGSVFFIAVPAVLLAFYFIVPRLCAFAGIGSRAQSSSSSS